MPYVISETCLLVPAGLTSSECASWIQAWGTIAAIGVAIWISHWQDRRARRERREIAIRRSRTLAATLSAAAERMIEIAPHNNFSECRQVLSTLEEAVIDGRNIEQELFSLKWTGAVVALRSTAAQMAEFLRLTRQDELNGNWQSRTAKIFDQHLACINQQAEIVRHAHPGIKISYVP